MFTHYLFIGDKTIHVEIDKQRNIFQLNTENGKHCYKYTEFKEQLDKLTEIVKKYGGTSDSQV